MAFENNIFVRITASKDGFDEVRKDLADNEAKIKDITKAMEALRKSEEKEIADIKKNTQARIEGTKGAREMIEAIKDEKKRLEALSKLEDEVTNIRKEEAAAIEDVTRKYKKQATEQENLAKSTKESIESLEDTVNIYNLLNGSSKSVTRQIRELREIMMQFEEDGKENTEVYEQMAIKAAELTDQQGDLQQRIRYLASDTKNLDSLMSGGAGLAGAFNTATSAVELLGGETEGLQKAFYKVQATLSVLNGIQEVANALNKDSAFRVVAVSQAQKFLNKEWGISIALRKASNALENKVKGDEKGNLNMTADQAETYKALSKALQISAKGFGVLRKAIIASGVGLIVVAVAGLVAYFDELNDQLGQSFEGWDKFKQAVMGVFEVIRGSLVNIGEALVRLVHGDFSGALEAVKQVADVESKYVAGVAKETARQAINVTKEVYELAMAQNNKAQALYAKNLTDGLRMINRAQLEAKSAMNKRHASEVEMAAEELEFAKQRAAITQEQNQKAIKANQGEINAAKRVMDANAKSLAAQKKGTQQYLDALNEYLDAQNNYYNALQKTNDLQQAIDDANQEVVDAGLSLQDAMLAQQDELVRARIDIMAAGREKEIAQIEASYAQQLRSLQGEGEQEIALRKAIEEKKAREVQAVRDKYNSQERETTLNHLLQMAKIEESTAQDPISKINAMQKVFDAEKALRDHRLAIIQADYEAERISKEDFDAQRLEMEREEVQAEIALHQQKMQQIQEAFSNVLSYMSNLSSAVFEALGNNVRAQMDLLDEEYTTDAEEAAKNSKKKYISEEAYERKKAALTLKQQRLNKASAIFSIGIQTAQAIMQAFATAPWPINIAMAALAATTGAVQLGVAASKPLPQYAKGRKGGKGEYAMVGERGAEIMYVPEGASIIPHNAIGDQDKWSQFGVPKLPTPDLPNFDADEVSKMMLMQYAAAGIDYDKLGRAVAANIPQQKAVTVNVDKSGITVTNGRETRKYLNKKYAGVC